MQRKSPVKVKGRAGRKKNMEKWKKSCNEYKSIGENDEGDKEKRLLKKEKRKYTGKKTHEKEKDDKKLRNMHK